MKKKLIKENAEEVEKAISDAKKSLKAALMAPLTKLAMDLQKLQSGIDGRYAKVAVMGMSADISQLLTDIRKDPVSASQEVPHVMARVEKISSAIKSGDEKAIEAAMSESTVRKLLRSLILEEIKAQKSFKTK